MEKKKFLDALSSENFGHFDDMCIFTVDATESTNTDAKEYCRKHGCEAVFIAKRQTAGRGRLGKSFDSAEGGLYMSYLFPIRGAFSPAKITITAGVALVRALEKLAGVSPRIKWVNDVFLGGKKLGGILAEGVLSDDGRVAYGVVGFGVNLLRRDFAELSNIATSLEAECGVIVDAYTLAGTILDEYLKLSNDFSATLAEYKSKMLLVGRDVMVSAAGESYIAHVVGLDDSGGLLVKRQNTQEVICISSGDASLRII